MKRIVLVFLPLFLSSCGPSLSQTTIVCAPGRTVLDGTCVAEGVVDYVACVRAQGAELDAGKRQALAADVGVLQAKVSGSVELDERLLRKYSASDQAILEIVRACSSVAGRSSTVAEQTGPSPSAAAATPAPSLKNGLYKGAGPNVYVVTEGKRYWVPDTDSFQAMGLDWNNIQVVDDTVLAGLGDATPIPQLRDGSLLKGKGPNVYRLEGGRRRWVPDGETFNAMGLDWSAVVTVPDGAVQAISEGAGFPTVRK